MHLVLHVLVPALLAVTVFRGRALPAFGLMMAGMLIDVDHLLADPVYDAQRCSIGFHPLHTWPAALVYLGLAVWKPTRIFGVGLLVHLGLDTGDCLGMPGGWPQLLSQMGHPWIR